MIKSVYNLVYYLLPNKYKLILKKVRLGYTLVNAKDSYLVQTGYVDSVMNHSLTDENIEHIPWMNYPFVSFLKEKLKKDTVVFEYGSGFSTSFFAKRVKKIVSVEYDKNWYENVNSNLLKGADNAEVKFEDLSDSYPQSIKKYLAKGECDFVVIDGRMRVDCAKAAIDYLSPRGVLVFDDSFRERYQTGLKFIRKQGFREITFKGLKPTGFGTDETTLFYREENCLGI